MTVKELKDFLNKFPDNMEIIEKRCSDYNTMSLDSWETVWAISKVKRENQYGNKEWITKYHFSIPDEEATQYVFYSGN